MSNKRLVWFFITIALGLAAGLAYGWLINPVQYIETSADSLHPGFKADYVLMVAEIYKTDGDLPGAVQRLALLGSLSAERLVADALLTARAAGYSAPDLALMDALSQAIKQAASPGAPDTGLTPTAGDQP